MATVQGTRAESTAESGRQGRWRFDAVTVLTAYAALLLLVPSRLIFDPLGAVGTPAGVVGLGALIWWANARLVLRLGGARGLQPVRLAYLALAAAVFASYGAAATSPMTGVEISGADRGILFFAVNGGVLLLAADGITDQRRLDTLVRRVVALGAVVATVGIVQFFAGIDISGWVRIPGLSANAEFGELIDRSIFKRASGTAIHPIEFGVVLAMVFPLALHLVMESTRQRWRWWLAFGLVVLAQPMAVSRSGILGLGGAVIVLFAGWRWRRRLRFLVAAPFVLVGMRLLVPGLLGTVRSLFVNLTSDPSYQGRTDDYTIVGRLISERPVFGRGFGTFDPTDFVLIDNQYLGTIIELGFVGFVALLALLFAGYFSARGARRRSEDPVVRHQAQALAAAIVVAILSFVTFDAFAFPMVTGVLFLVIGCCGAQWRLALAASSRIAP